MIWNGVEYTPVRNCYYIEKGSPEKYIASYKPMWSTMRVLYKDELKDGGRKPTVIRVVP